MSDVRLAAGIEVRGADHYSILVSYRSLGCDTARQKTKLTKSQAFCHNITQQVCADIGTDFTSLLQDGVSFSTKDGTPHIRRVHKY